MAKDKTVEVKTGVYMDLNRNLIRVLVVAKSVETGERVVVFVPQHGPQEGEALTQNAVDFADTIVSRGMTWHGGPYAGKKMPRKGVQVDKKA